MTSPVRELGMGERNRIDCVNGSGPRELGQKSSRQRATSFNKRQKARDRPLTR